jgi:hypothetical protein
MNSSRRLIVNAQNGKISLSKSLAQCSQCEINAAEVV